MELPVRFIAALYGLAPLRNNRRLHEFAALEGGDVGGIELEPFAILAFCGKAVVPIGFDARRVIGGNSVDRLQGFGKTQAEFIGPAAGGVAPANLEKFSGLHQIDKPEGVGRGTGRGPRRANARKMAVTEESNLLKILTRAAMFGDFREESGF